jgi:hypothetical protein
MWYIYISNPYLNPILYIYIHTHICIYMYIFAYIYPGHSAAFSSSGGGAAAGSAAGGAGRAGIASARKAVVFGGLFAAESARVRNPGRAVVVPMEFRRLSSGASVGRGGRCPCAKPRFLGGASELP